MFFEFINCLEIIKNVEKWRSKSIDKKISNYTVSQFLDESFFKDWNAEFRKAHYLTSTFYNQKSLNDIFYLNDLYETIESYTLSLELSYPKS